MHYLHQHIYNITIYTHTMYQQNQKRCIERWNWFLYTKYHMQNYMERKAMNIKLFRRKLYDNFVRDSNEKQF